MAPRSRAKPASWAKPAVTSEPVPPPDDATAAIRDAIRAYVPDAIRELARLAHEAGSEQARVAAINALIDRGYGNLKHPAEAQDAVSGITVRFVAPSDET